MSESTPPPPPDEQGQPGDIREGQDGEMEILDIDGKWKKGLQGAFTTYKSLLDRLLGRPDTEDTDRKIDPPTAHT